jgi:hypothetical protein
MEHLQYAARRSSDAKELLASLERGCAVPVTLTVGNASSQPGVTIVVSAQ